MSINKPIANIVKGDLDDLLQARVKEARNIEYKQGLPGFSDDDKREFLADVSSFANGAGGDLLYGVTAQDGVPTDIQGLPQFNFDETKLRLEDMLRNGIEPRIPGIEFSEIPGFSAGPVLLMRIPRSFAWPHIVKFKNWSRFFTRSSAGKYQMDVGELRAAFAVSESLGEKFKRFRVERVSRIVAGESPVLMGSGPKVVLHIIPFTDIRIGPHLSGDQKSIVRSRFVPHGGVDKSTYNADGFLQILDFGDATAEAYSLLFWNGVIESAWTRVVGDVGDQAWIRGRHFEEGTVSTVASSVVGLNELGVPPPILIMATFVGVRGLAVYVGDRFDRFRRSYPIDRDVLLLPDVVMDSHQSDSGMIAQLLRPLLDGLWNASGLEGSPSYDKDGIWTPPRA